jgi:hypothetical protein
MEVGGQHHPAAALASEKVTPGTKWMRSRVYPITGLVGFLFGFLTLEDGTDKLPQNVGKN